MGLAASNPGAKVEQRRVGKRSWVNAGDADPAKLEETKWSRECAGSVTMGPAKKKKT